MVESIEGLETLQLNRICVFCGSSSGIADDYRKATEQLGDELVNRGLRVVYGGGSTGLMGVLADRILCRGGFITGVIPKGLNRDEICHRKLSRTYVVQSMHERKATMYKLSDAFIALPGGYGTFEELLESITWAQLGISEKPIGVLNVKGYYNPILEQISKAGAAGFIKDPYQKLLVSGKDPAQLLDELEKYRIPPSTLWEISAEG